MAGTGGRLHRRGGIAKAAGRRADHALWRLRSDGGQSACRQSGAVARAAAVSVARPSSHRGGRRGDRFHRRSQRQDGGAAVADARKCWSPTSPASRINCGDCWISKRRPIRPGWWTMPTGRGPSAYLDFLRDIGKHFSVNQMVAKESVRARMEDRESGISYTEFSYMLLQAFDFYHLRKDVECELQIGGAINGATSPPGLISSGKKLGNTCLRPHFAAHHQRRRHQIRQDRGRRHLAGCEEDQRLSILPILDSHRRPRRDRYLKYFTLSGQGRDRCAGSAARRQARSPRGAQGAGQAMTADSRRDRDGGSRSRQRDSFWRRIGRREAGNVCGNRGRSTDEAN